MKFELKPTKPNPGEVPARIISRFQSRRKRKATVVGAVLFLMGMVQLAVAIFSGRYEYNILKTWSAVDGMVTKSEIIKNRAKGNTWYSTKVEFKYSVNGKDYQSPSWSSHGSSSYAEMKRQADAFAPGTRHSLVYNPADPKDIRFDAAYTLSFFMGPAILGAIGLAFSGAGCLVWYHFKSL